MDTTSTGMVASPDAAVGVAARGAVATLFVGLLGVAVALWFLVGDSVFAQTVLAALAACL